MPTRLSIAMALSTAIHLALFVVADLLLGDDALPPQPRTPLLVQIEKPPEPGDEGRESGAVTLEKSKVGDQEKARLASRASETMSQKLTAMPMVIAEERVRHELRPAHAATRADKTSVVVRDTVETETRNLSATNSEQVASPDVITAARSGAPHLIVGAPKTEAPARAKSALTQKQLNMLNRKVKEWSENPEIMPSDPSGLTWEYNGQEYFAKFTQLPAADAMAIQRVSVEISTEEDGKRFSSEVLLKRLAFSNFAQFVNRWDPDVEIHNDELEGRFHSNTRINLTYDRKVTPRFLGKVTTAARKIRFTTARVAGKPEQIFQGGLETGVRAIRLPKHFLPSPEEANAVGNQMQTFENHTRITFDADGSFLWQAIDANAEPRRVTMSGNTTYLIAEDKVRLHVKGEVNGKVLVYSPERIVIEGDLVYADDPEVAPESDDYLGLVSDKNVDIAPPRVTGPGDLSIHAAIYAKRRFAVKRYRSREQGLLYLYGSLSVGSLSATEPRFSTRIRFDPRLEALRPPGFPMTNRYEVETWDEAWNAQASH